MEIKLSTGRKLKLKPITRDMKDNISDTIEYNHAEDKDGNWQKVDMKAPQAMITRWMRETIIGGDFKKFATNPNGQPTDDVIDQLNMKQNMMSYMVETVVKNLQYMMIKVMMMVEMTVNLDLVLY